MNKKVSSNAVNRLRAWMGWVIILSSILLVISANINGLGANIPNLTFSATLVGCGVTVILLAFKYPRIKD